MLSAERCYPLQCMSQCFVCVRTSTLLNSTALFFPIGAPVVKKMDSTIHRINHYPWPVGKYLENQLRYPVDRDLPLNKLDFTK